MENKVRAMKEVEIFFEIEYDHIYEQSLKGLIDYMRKLQENYEIGFANISGLTCLGSMLRDNAIDQQLYDSIKPAVEYYTVPYELIKTE